MTKPRVLVVDDEKIVRDLLLRILSKQFDVQIADSGREALKKISQDGFNLLIVDLKMPGIEGLDLLKQVKRVNHSTEVIIMTGYDTPGMEIKAMGEGAYAYITKPLDIKELQSIIKRCLERH